MFIKANGIQMNYELSGKKDGPIVMLSHALGSSLLMWNPQRKVLEPRFQVLRYDVRGHGRSDGWNDRTVRRSELSQTTQQPRPV